MPDPGRLLRVGAQLARNVMNQLVIRDCDSPGEVLWWRAVGCYTIPNDECDTGVPERDEIYIAQDTRCTTGFALTPFAVFFFGDQCFTVRPESYRLGCTVPLPDGIPCVPGNSMIVPRGTLVECVGGGCTDPRCTPPLRSGLVEGRSCGAYNGPRLFACPLRYCVVKYFDAQCPQVSGCVKFDPDTPRFRRDYAQGHGLIVTLVDDPQNPLPRSCCQCEHLHFPAVDCNGNLNTHGACKWDLYPRFLYPNQLFECCCGTELDRARSTTTLSVIHQVLRIPGADPIQFDLINAPVTVPFGQGFNQVAIIRQTNLANMSTLDFSTGLGVADCPAGIGIVGSTGPDGLLPRPLPGPYPPIDDPSSAPYREGTTFNVGQTCQRVTVSYHCVFSNGGTTDGNYDISLNMSISAPCVDGCGGRAVPVHRLRPFTGGIRSDDPQAAAAAEAAIRAAMGSGGCFGCGQ